MISGYLSSVPTEAWYALGALMLGSIAFAIGYYLAVHRTEETDLVPIDGLEEGEGFETAAYGPGEDAGFLQTYRREKKKRQALSQGMYRWHLVGSNFSQPKYVKPKREEGGNVPEIEHEDETYLFPEDATVPSEEEGVPVVVHRIGESEPINLRDSWDDAIDASTLSEYLTLRVTSRKPSKGMFDGLFGENWDPMAVFRYGLLAIVGLAILMEVAGGGIW